jgi:NodT family efflux transporter outer membrane factor (OMF) lipoprotein
MTFTHKSRLIGPSALTAGLLLATGCMVGPKYKAPAPPQVTGYTPAPVTTTSATPNVAGGESQKFAQGQDIPGEWWMLFHSKPLEDLIERSLKVNPDIKAAQAALLVARENALAQRGAYFPSASAGFSADHSKTSNVVSPFTANGALTYSLYTPQVSVSFVPDVFGLNRRTVESLVAQEQQARFVLAATHITLSSNIAAAAIQEASSRAQIDATRELIRINTDMLKILRDQFAKGYVSRLDVAAQESQLAQVTATLPPLLKQLAQQRDLLAALSGGFPSQDLPEKFELSSLQLPEELPVSLPSQLVEQRPDVRQAEENLHSASALIGVAVANRLPSFALTGDAGSMALVFTRMLQRTGREGRVCSGFGAIPKHGSHRVSECSRYIECARTRCRRVEERGKCKRRCQRHPRSDEEAVSDWLRQLPCTSQRGTGVSASKDEPRSGSD